MRADFLKPFSESLVWERSGDYCRNHNDITEAASLIENLPTKYIPADKGYNS